VPLRASYLILFYLGKIFWPVNLSSVYLLPEPVQLGKPIYLFCVVALAILVVAAILLVRRMPAIPIGLIFFVLAIAPTLGIVNYSWIVASDKYVYFPAFGLLLIAAWLLSMVLRAGSPILSFAASGENRPATARPRNRRMIVGLLTVIALAAAESIATRQYLEDWQSTRSLYLHMMRLTPQVAMLHTQLGIDLMQRHRRAEALAEFAAALRLDPGSAEAHFNIGWDALQHGELDAAIQHYRAGLHTRPTEFLGRMDLGDALLAKGEPAAALEQFEIAITLRPESAEARLKCGVAFARLKQPEQASKRFREAITLDPNRAPAAHRGLAHIFSEQQKPRKAIAELKQSLLLQPDSDAFAELGKLLVDTGQRQEAVLAFREALRLNPRNPTARKGLEGLDAK
jgi:tetratricopeptide (TPR) repeat protein